MLNFSLLNKIYFGGLLPVVCPEYSLKNIFSSRILLVVESKAKKNFLLIILASVFETEVLEEWVAISQFWESPEVVFTLFNPLMYCMSKMSRTFLLTEHGDNENTSISIVMMAL